MAKFNIDTTEAKTMGALKDFQRATVERIDYYACRKSSK